MSPRRQSLFEKVNGWQYGTPGRELLMELIGGRQLRAERATSGFVILREAARDAVPDLARIAAHGSTSSATLALGVLPYVGRDSIHPLLSVLTNTALPRSNRRQAMFYLSQMQYIRTNAHPFTVALIRCLDDPELAEDAAGILPSEYEKDLFLPALIECTHSTNTTARMWAADSLGRLGANAWSAIPDLTKLLNDPAASVREAATNSLIMITP